MKMRAMRIPTLAFLTLVLAGCAGNSAKYGDPSKEIDKELAASSSRKAPVAPSADVTKALLPPLKMDMPAWEVKLAEPRFDLVVNDAPVKEVLMGIVSGTRYNLLLHPDVAGTISVDLKNVTVFQALDAIRDLYGYEYQVEGNTISVQPVSLQTRVFKVNYLTGKRTGTSTIRVLSGSVSDSPQAGMPGAVAPATSATSGLVGGGTSMALESGRISTKSVSDFWPELTSALTAIVGSDGGRKVVVNPQSGVIVVRAMPGELRNVAKFLEASQLSVDRQVILEAKIIKVQLSDAYQAGINWAAFKTGPNSRVSLGQIEPGVALSPNGNLAGAGSPVTGTPGTNLSNSNTVPAANSTNPLGTLMGVAFQTSSFASLLSFLEGQGTVHVLSSPRIATLNNQNAILKVGTDQLFVTNVSSTTTLGGTATSTTPSVTLQPFFSGIMLDVTPEIDENDRIILHIHPSVSVVTQTNQTINLGTGVGTLTLPLPVSNVSETDSIVRATDGQIVAIGGLMTQESDTNRSQIPGLGDIPGVGTLFGQDSRSLVKTELVILLKATVVRDGGAWSQDILDSRHRIREMEKPGNFGG